MSCFPCFGGGKKDKKDSSSDDDDHPNHAPGVVHKKAEPFKAHGADSPALAATPANIQAQNFTFRDLATATKNFTPDSLLGEGGFGRVYKGVLDNGARIVAVKQLDRNSTTGNKEFLVEVLMLSLLNHPNLLSLVGYCADGDQKFLVHEFMPNGTLQKHLLDLQPNQKPLDWYTRMRIAFGAAQGLEYLHDKANPPIIYRDMKSSSILLDDLFTPKLSDFGLSKLRAGGDKPGMASMVMDTYGYSAPEFAANGEISMKSDVYSFGVIFLELITGRRANDPTKPATEQNLVAWAKPYFKEQKRYPELVDPLLQGKFPLKALNQAVAIAAMCLQDESSVRPLMADAVITLSFLIEPMPGDTEMCAASVPQSTPPPQPQPQPQPQPLPAKHKKSSSSSSEEHVVETLQLGHSKEGHSSSRQGSGSSSCSESSGSDDGPNSKHRKKSSSSRKHHKKASKDGSSDSSSGSKHSRSSRLGSGMFLSISFNGATSSKHSSGTKPESDEESDGSGSRHSSESD